MAHYLAFPPSYRFICLQHDFWAFLLSTSCFVWLSAHRLCLLNIARKPLVINQINSIITEDKPKKLMLIFLPAMFPNHKTLQTLELNKSWHRVKGIWLIYSCCWENKLHTPQIRSHIFTSKFSSKLWALSLWWIYIHYIWIGINSY